MDTTMAERLKTALAARGMTPPDLIKATGMSRAGVYFLLDGTTTAEKIRATTVAKLCKSLNVNREWLLSSASVSEVVEAATIECNKEFGELGGAFFDEAMSQQVAGKLTPEEASLIFQNGAEKVRSEARDSALVETIKERRTAHKASAHK